MSLSKNDRSSSRDDKDPPRTLPANDHKDGKADVIMLAHATLDDPQWPNHAAKALGVPDFKKLLSIRHVPP